MPKNRLKSPCNLYDSAKNFFPVLSSCHLYLLFKKIVNTTPLHHLIRKSSRSSSSCFFYLRSICGKRKKIVFTESVAFEILLRIGLVASQAVGETFLFRIGYSRFSNSPIQISVSGFKT